jgi:glucosyl-3-phosphoglycerate synthase
MQPALLPPGTGLSRHSHHHFAPGELQGRKLDQQVTVHVAIPARNEAATIAPIVETIRRLLIERVALVDELVVVDDGSVDATAERARSAGAEVVRGPGKGKGEAMAHALSLFPPSERALVVFLDGDVEDFGPHFVTGLLGPLLTEPGIELVKGAYARPPGPGGAGGGRVTELVAKPALSLYFPELALLSQPLAGETAMRASLAKELSLAPGYAVEVAALIDTYNLAGLKAIAEVDLGERHHRNRPLRELVPQAEQVLGAILERAGALGRSLR